MVETSKLAYAYPNGHVMEFPDISLTPGEHLLVLGPSGVGKTTLLYLLAGLLPPLRGTVSIAGIKLNTLTRREMDTFRGESMGIIFQQYYFIKSLNVNENLRLRQRYPKKDDNDRRRHDLGERLGLASIFDKRVYSLSQGQRQRLSIALGLIHKPRIVFADEPTSNLDDLNCTKVIDLLKEEAELCGSSLLIITHDRRVISHFKNRVEL